MVRREELGAFEIKSYPDTADEAGLPRTVNTTVVLLAPSPFCVILLVKRISSLLVVVGSCAIFFLFWMFWAGFLKGVKVKLIRQFPFLLGAERKFFISVLYIHTLEK